MEQEAWKERLNVLHIGQHIEDVDAAVTVGISSRPLARATAQSRPGDSGPHRFINKFAPRLLRPPIAVNKFVRI